LPKIIKNQPKLLKNAKNTRLCQKISNSLLSHWLANTDPFCQKLSKISQNGRKTPKIPDFVQKSAIVFFHNG